MFAKHEKIWSVSRLTMLMNCPRKYWFKYIAGIPDSKKYYLTRGIVFHDVVAEFLLAQSKPLEFWQNRTVEKFTEQKAKGEPVSDERVSEDQVLSSILNAFESYYNKVKSLNEPIKVLTYHDGVNEPLPTVELPFKVPFVDIDTMEQHDVDYDLLGYIDLESYDEVNGLSIRDHKLHSKKYSQFALDTDLQLSLYAYSFVYLLKMGCYPELNIDNIIKHRVIRAGLNSNHISRYNGKVTTEFVNVDITFDRMKADVLTAIDIIYNSENMRFTPNWTEDCGWKCSYNDPCLMMKQGKDITDYIRAARDQNEEKKLKALLDSMEEEVF